MSEPQDAYEPIRQGVRDVAARLSHDRGADGDEGVELWKALVDVANAAADYSHWDVQSSSVDEKQDRVLMALDRLAELGWRHDVAALSVPAPTLPALDALRDAQEQLTAAFASDGIAVAEKVWPLGPQAVFAAMEAIREALRDAV